MAGVEFLSEAPDDGPEEELVVEPRTRRRRRGPLVAVAVAVLAAVVAVVVAHAGGSSTPRAASDTGTNPIAPEQPSGADRLDHLGPTTAPEGARASHRVGRTGLPSNTIECSSPSGCRVAVSLPAGVIAAVRQLFPRTSDIAGRTILTDVDLPASTIVSRTVDASDGPLRLHIGVHLANDHDDPRRGSNAQSGGRVVYATALRDGLAVVVTVTGPAARVPAVGTVAALADDERLVVPV